MAEAQMTYKDIINFLFEIMDALVF